MGLFSPITIERICTMTESAGLSALDYAEIHNLYAFYNLSSDSGAPEDYASCFTEDGEMIVAQRGLIAKGRADLVTYKRNDQASRGSKYRRHWNNNIHIEKLSDGSVRGRCYLRAFNGEPGNPPENAGHSVYEDTIVKVEGAWKFARRHLTLD